MSKRSPSADNGRHIFLKEATLAGAAAGTNPVAANMPASIPSKEGAKAAVPGPRMAAAETMPPADPDPVSQSSSGGDFMVDVLKSVDIDYLAINEEAVGAAIAAPDVQWGDLFVTSKIWHEHLSPDAIRRAFDRSLAKLRLHCVDLYTAHAPSKSMAVATMLWT